MKIWAAASPGLVALMLATTPAVACSALVVNGYHETIAYTCWAANLTEVAKEPAPIVEPVKATPKPVTRHRSHKCWYTNRHHKRRWRRC